jgi:hypothetical protein
MLILNKSKKVFSSKFKLVTLLALVSPIYGYAGIYDINISNAVSYLGSQQTAQGSIGADDNLNYLNTAQVLWSLRIAKQNTSDVYKKSLVWLQNYNINSNDYLARKILAMYGSGLNVQPYVDILLQNQKQEPTTLTNTYNTGWGLNNADRSSNIDTALSLIAMHGAGVPSKTVQDGLLQLINTRTTNGSESLWNINYDNVEELSSTMYAIIALSKYKDKYNLTDVINQGISAIVNRVNISSSNHLKALAILAINYGNPNHVYINTLLSNLIAAQQANGSWDNDVYTTALAMQAIASVSGYEANISTQIIDIKDVNLRNAILSALGKPSNYIITRADLLLLTTLNLNGKGISNLQGLQYASNLTNLDVRNNPLVSLDPIQGLIKASAGNAAYSLLYDNIANYNISTQSPNAFSFNYQCINAIGSASNKTLQI